MKFPHLAIFTLFTLLTVSCGKEVTSTPIDNKPESVRNVTTSVVESGNFKTLEHSTQGKVSVISDNGISYLQFNQSFKTDSGPDLVVILHRGNVPSKSLKEQEYVSVAKLQNIKGSQRYALPKNVNLADFNSVAIWCRKFNVTFGYASLPKTN
ncbi:DM13 domain-containing protein [Anabaena sphaerica FACHB-251]|uniref:DM13 domain-containing protein n=1 Tax=Anabaena sphaerica FACHB-251 TaxID=2692883 RepID=A0A927A2Y7_9NOST|nr:DM13 domain-containing protein [Anabaena sphaerica]MBD2296254.1 DM13 domain-containing protein [Anabaena sphaerica FACHB-251]